MPCATASYRSAGLAALSFQPLVYDRAGDRFHSAARGAEDRFLNRFPVREMNDHDPVIADYADADRVCYAPMIHRACCPETLELRYGRRMRNARFESPRVEHRLHR